jgi:solute carrier family 25 (mitochondrial phosphate transporter), member 23/24/25/41
MIEFHTFVRQAEKELWNLFKSIDHDNNGKLDKDELRSAFLRAGLTVPAAKLNLLFNDVDTNRDGVISFDEWRYCTLSLSGNRSQV